MPKAPTTLTLTEYLAQPGKKLVDLARDLKTSPSTISEMKRTGRADSIFIEVAPDGSVTAFEKKPVPRRRRQDSP